MKSEGRGRCEGLGFGDERHPGHLSRIAENVCPRGGDHPKKYGKRPSRKCTSPSRPTTSSTQVASYWSATASVAASELPTHRVRGRLPHPSPQPPRPPHIRIRVSLSFSGQPYHSAPAAAATTTTVTPSRIRLITITLSVAVRPLTTPPSIHPAPSPLSRCQQQRLGAPSCRTQPGPFHTPSQHIPHLASCILHLASLLLAGWRLPRRGQPLGALTLYARRIHVAAANTPSLPPWRRPAPACSDAHLKVAHMEMTTRVLVSTTIVLRVVAVPAQATSWSPPRMKARQAYRNWHSSDVRT